MATGHAATLPALYGLASIQDQDVVIILRKGKESIVFLGDDGYKINWSRVTRVFPLTMAPSGHLVIECDKYSGAQESLAGDALTFVTDHTNSSASADTRCPEKIRRDKPVAEVMVRLLPGIISTNQRNAQHANK